MKIETKDGTCTMYLYNRKKELVAKTIFDEDDYDFVSAHKWHLSTNGYVTCSKPFMRLHNKVNKTKKGFVTDHINRIKLDNRKLNLREVLQKYNCLNKLSKGYTYEPRNKFRNWKTQLTIGKKYIYSKCHLTEDEAREDAIRIRKKYLGKYTPLNQNQSL